LWIHCLSLLRVRNNETPVRSLCYYGL
jgi:hypothetical protein